MLRLKLFHLVAILTAISVSCRQSNPSAGGSCVSSVDVGLKFTPSEDQSLGGYLKIEYDQSLRAGAEVNFPNEDQFCGVFVHIHNFNKDAPPPDGIGATLWTAKHCIYEAYAKSVSLVLKPRPGSTVNGAQKNTFSSDEIEVEVISKMRNILQATDRPKYQNFAKFYHQYKIYGPADMIDDFIWLKVNGILPDDDPDFKRKENFYIEYTERQQRCALPADFETGYENKGNTLQATCFTHSDLAAFQAKIKVAPQFVPYLYELHETQIFKFVEAGESSTKASRWMGIDFISKPTQAAASSIDRWLWHYSNETNTIGMAAIGQCLFDEQKNIVAENNTTKSDTGTNDDKDTAFGFTSASDCPDLGAVSAQFGGGLTQGSNPGNYILNHFKANLDRLETWSAIRQDLASVTEGSLFFHSNLQSDQNADRAASDGSPLAVFEEVSFKDLYVGGEFSITQDAEGYFARNNQKAAIQFNAKDSGSVVTIGGVLPILALSSVDGVASSGGAPARIPQYENIGSEDIAYSDDGGSQAYTENPNVPAGSPVVINGGSGEGSQTGFGSEGSNNTGSGAFSENTNQNTGTSGGQTSGAGSDVPNPASSDASAAQPVRGC